MPRARPCGSLHTSRGTWSAILAGMSQEMATPETDSLLGSYRLVKEIGRGGMGTVFEATTRHCRGGGRQGLARRATAVPGHGHAHGPGGLDPRAHPASGHRTRLPVRAAPDHRPWIAMELVEGETLSGAPRDERQAVCDRGRHVAGERRRRARVGPRARHRPSRSQARQSDPDAARSRLPAAIDRLGDRAARADGQAHARRVDARHSDLHVARTSDGPHIAAAVRHLLARRDRVRSAVRRATVRRQDARRSRVHAHHVRGRAAQRAVCGARGAVRTYP